MHTAHCAQTVEKQVRTLYFDSTIFRQHFIRAYAIVLGAWLRVLFRVRVRVRVWVRVLVRMCLRACRNIVRIAI